jgi:hypothetical protein
MHREDEGGRVVSLSSSPSMEDLELGGVHPHPFAARPTARRALSLSLHVHVSTLEACFASHLATSSGELASRGFP